MKGANISEIIRIASNVSVIFPLAVYLAKASYASKRIHIIGMLVIVSGVCDVVGMYLFRQSSATAALFNAYYVIMFALMFWFYYEVVFIKSRRLIIWIGLAVYLQSFILITLYVQSFFEYQTLLWVITGIIMIIFSIEYFLYLFSARPTVNLLNYTTMWINSGVMVYFGFNLFLFLITNYVFTHLDREASILLWSFHNVNNILKNILFGIGLSMHRKKIADFQ
ncbi:MAG TPA: hypothetical protein VEB86_04815 [Chryseosolibacter sp.]|nr:hypothetical protein [Chryseosolibacter sp.]